MTLTPEQLAADKALAEKATPGPWHNDSGDPGDVVVWGLRRESDGDQEFIGNVGGTNFKDVSVVFDADSHNGRFIARFNPKTALEYIAALEAANARIAKLEAALKNIAAQHLHAEMEPDDAENADWIEGYEGCVRVARAALEKEKP